MANITYEELKAYRENLNERSTKVLCELESLKKRLMTEIIIHRIDSLNDKSK